MNHKYSFKLFETILINNAQALVSNIKKKKFLLKCTNKHSERKWNDTVIRGQEQYLHAIVRESLLWLTKQAEAWLRSLK